MAKAYASQVIATAINEIGYREKASNSQLESKTANAGDNSYTKYANFFDSKVPNFYNGPKNGYDWCDMFVDWCFCNTFGVDKGRELLCQPLQSAGAGCIYSYGYYKAKGQVGTTPKVGAQVFFGSYEGGLYHTGLVEKFDATYVYTIEGNTSSSDSQYDSVARHTYKRVGGGIYGYGYPAYDGETAPAGTTTTNTTTTTAQTSTTTNTTTSTTATTTTSGAPSKTVKWTGYVLVQVSPRTWAGTSNASLKTVGILNKGDTVQVCDTIKADNGDDWYYVFINNKAYGFIPVANVSKTKPTTTTAQTSTTTNTITSTTATTTTSGAPSKTVKWTGTVTADVLNVRKWAGTENSTLTSTPSITYGTKVGVCDSVKARDGSTWYYVLINNSVYGFVHSAYISK